MYRTKKCQTAFGKTLLFDKVECRRISCAVSLIEVRMETEICADCKSCFWASPGRHRHVAHKFPIHVAGNKKTTTFFIGLPNACISTRHQNQYLHTLGKLKDVRLHLLDKQSSTPTDWQNSKPSAGHPKNTQCATAQSVVYERRNQPIRRPVDVLQDHFRGPDLSEHLVPTVGGSTCAGCSNVFSWLDVYHLQKNARCGAPLQLQIWIRPIWFHRNWLCQCVTSGRVMESRRPDTNHCIL